MNGPVEVLTWHHFIPQLVSLKSRILIQSWEIEHYCFRRNWVLSQMCDEINVKDSSYSSGDNFVVGVVQLLKVGTNARERFPRDSISAQLEIQSQNTPQLQEAVALRLSTHHSRGSLAGNMLVRGVLVNGDSCVLLSEHRNQGL